MTLTPGTRLGPYEILSALGAGGMGEVYRASDTNLKRRVAIKVLPASVAADAERLARFQREAEVLAAVNHPNIAVIYGLERSGPTTALVMELVEGEDLSQRIARGAIPLDEALPIAQQIAEALEAAHEQGIIHRDLKPANIKVRADGTVKVLDFGLAKAIDPFGSAPNVSQSPTITTPAMMTGVGVILGTAAYMSPEQAKGRPVDRRSDIWAFGCIFYEMLTGKRAFESEDVPETLASVLKGEPDWDLLPPNVPFWIRRVLTLCLAKNRTERISDVAVAQFLLSEKWSIDAPSAAASETARRHRLRSTGVGLVAGILLTATVTAAWLSLGRSPTQPAKVSFEISTESSASPNQIALSPDGTRLASVVRTPQGNAIGLRRLDEGTGQTLAATFSGAGDPAFLFWSPDSRFLAFFASGKLSKIDVAGGLVQTLCDAPRGRGGTWNRDGLILFAPSDGPLFKVPASGGVPLQVTDLDSARGDRAHRHPKFLPDGEHFVFFVVSQQGQNDGLYLGAVDSKVTTRLVASDTMGIFAPPGHLLFMRGTTLMAQRFDAHRLELLGDPFRVAQDVGRNRGNSTSGVTASDTGVLAYRRVVGVFDRILRWFDRTGKVLGEVGGVGSHENVTLAPDGKRLAEARLDGLAGSDIWTMDLVRGSGSRITFDAAIDDQPIWSPDARRIVFASERDGGVRNLYIKNADGAGQEELLLKTDGAKYPTDWSRDGQYVLYTQVNSSPGLWVLPVSGEKKPFPFLQTPFEDKARFSPDGRWIAYVSTESGPPQIYVQSFPRSGGKWQITTSGGADPRWRGDGRELFYLADGAFWAVEVSGTDSKSFSVGIPRKLFDTFVESIPLVTHYDVAPDGQRFLVSLSSVTPNASPPIRVVLNWAVGLEQ